jgi:uncharacterized protein
MVIGLYVWELHLHGCSSLKQKRAVIKSLKDRLHRQFNVSVAETDLHDVHERAELAACVVAAERRHADSVLTSADRVVESESEARIVRSEKVFY